MTADRPARVLVRPQPFLRIHRDDWEWFCYGCSGRGEWLPASAVHDDARNHAKYCTPLHLARLLGALQQLETGYRGTSFMFLRPDHLTQFNRGYSLGFENAAERLASLLRTYRGQG